ncbi:hypothetical protein HJFPF1_04576 [Paramyrothecium foliicola]|nr:hypothetical protein HJFPF1_04576 [Paramyrothecium foliicola]
MSTAAQASYGKIQEGDFLVLCRSIWPKFFNILYDRRNYACVHLIKFSGSSAQDCLTHTLRLMSAMGGRAASEYPPTLQKSTTTLVNWDKGMILTDTIEDFSNN